jgi:hypothetical protein
MRKKMRRNREYKERMCRIVKKKTSTVKIWLRLIKTLQQHVQN